MLTYLNLGRYSSSESDFNSSSEKSSSSLSSSSGEYDSYDSDESNNDVLPKGSSKE